MLSSLYKSLNSFSVPCPGRDHHHSHHGHRHRQQQTTNSIKNVTYSIKEMGQGHVPFHGYVFQPMKLKKGTCIV